MHQKIWLSLIFMFALNSAEAREKVAGYLQRNLAGTSHYYSQLISGNPPYVAELTLFTNMMPKGGDLHNHYSGAIYTETYLDWVGALNFCIYRASDAELKIEKFQIVLKPQELSEAARALCMSAEAIRQDDALYRELLAQWSDKDYDNHFHEQPAPDQKFFKTFEYFDSVSTSDYKKGLQSLKERAQAENLGYLETMLKGSPTTDKPEVETLLSKLNAASSEQQFEEAFANAYALLANDAGTSAKIADYVQFLEDVSTGLDDESFKVRFQAYVSRNSSPSKVFGRLYTSFASAKRSKLIVGVNIVGPENRYVAMRDYSLHMKMFAFLKKRFPDVKLALHAGELTLGMVPPEGLRSHIREAVIVAGAARIGHGVDIAYETDALELLKIMKRRNIAVEVNLTSNAFILGVKNEAHPLMLYARHGVPFVISTDDPGVSRNNLSGEYLLYVSRYKPSYAELKRTIYNSIRYSFLPEDEKRDEMAKLDQRFVEFEARIANLPR